MSISIVNCLLSCRIDHEIEDLSVENLNLKHTSITPEKNGNTPEKLGDRFNKTHTIFKTGLGKYYEYSGVIHVHTTYSDGGGTYEEVLKAEVWKAHTERPTNNAILTICRGEEARDASALAYYHAREMAHWAHKGTR